MEVVFVLPGILPVPAVKGGAVQTLIESVVAQNEVEKKMNLTVICAFDCEAEKKALKYSNTNFLYIRENEVCTWIDNGIDRIIKNVKGVGKKHQYMWKIYSFFKIKSLLKKSNFDKVVFENFSFLLNLIKDPFFLNKYKGKIYYHLHNEIADNVYLKGLKECELILVSNYLSKKINKICKCNMNEKIHVVKNGIKIELFSQDLSIVEKQFLLKKLNISKEKKIIIYVGRIVPEKGIKQLVEAFKLLNRDDVVLLIVGSYNFGSGQVSTFENEIKKECEKLSNAIVFTGYVEYMDIWKYYKLADLAVLPTMCEEAAGLTMIEAAMAGIPVITTNAGGISEYLNSDLAIMIERDVEIVDNIKNSIQNILDNPCKWNAKALEACEYVVKNFSEIVYYDNFVNVLRD